MKVLALCAVLAAAAAFAESGQPPGVCEEPACFCNTRNCSCGETCNFGRSCSPVESRFCSTDGMCALPCGSVYLVHARKQISPLTLIRAPRRLAPRRMSVIPLATPRTRGTTLH